MAKNFEMGEAERESIVKSISSKKNKTVIVASNASESELTGCSDIWTLS